MSAGLLLRRSARALQKFAKMIHDSETVPSTGKFLDTPTGQADRQEYENMIADAEALRELAKRMKP